MATAASVDKVHFAVDSSTVSVVDAGEDGGHEMRLHKFTYHDSYVLGLCLFIGLKCEKVMFELFRLSTGLGGGAG